MHLLKVITPQDRRVKLFLSLGNLCCPFSTNSLKWHRLSIHTYRSFPLMQPQSHSFTSVIGSYTQRTGYEVFTDSLELPNELEIISNRFFFQNRLFWNELWHSGSSFLTQWNIYSFNSTGPKLMLLPFLFFHLSYIILIHPSSTHFSSLFSFHNDSFVQQFGFSFHDNWALGKNSTSLLTLEKGFLLYHFLFRFNDSKYFI